MSDEKMDRRVQRTRELLKKALMQLVDEKGYDAVTIQDITERANLGRTTFYSHYLSKDELLLDHHYDFASRLIMRPLDYGELMDETPPSEIEQFLQELYENKSIYLTITRGKDADVLTRGVRQQGVDNLLNSLEISFGDKEPKYDRDLLANYIIGAQTTLIDWWLTTRTPHQASEVATMLHQLRRVAIQQAFGELP